MYLRLETESTHQARLMYWITKYGDVFSTYSVNSSVHSSKGIENRLGTITLESTKRCTKRY